MRQPGSEESEIIMLSPSDEPNVRPCCTKKVGIEVTKPKINVLVTTRTMLPTIRRGNSSGDSSEPRLVEGAVRGAGAGGGKELPPDASRSISCISASASSVRPCDSSQRGDSGND